MYNTHVEMDPAYSEVPGCGERGVHDVQMTLPWLEHTRQLRSASGMLNGSSHTNLSETELLRNVRDSEAASLKDWSRDT